MGCSGSSRTIEMYDLRSKRKLELERLRYNENHSKFETLMLDPKVDQDFKTNLTGQNFDQSLESLMGKWCLKFEELKFSKADLKDVVSDLAAYEILENEFQFKNWDISDVVLNNIENQENLDNDKSESAKEVIKSMTRYFPSQQRGCVLDADTEEKLKMIGWKPIFNNLKFNENYKVQALSVIFTPFFLQNDAMQNLSEILQCNPQLKTMATLFHKKSQDEGIKNDFSPDFEQLLSLQTLFENVKHHKAIKVFIFGCVEAYKFSLPKESEKKLVELIASDKLNFLILTKIKLQKETIDAIINVIPTLNHLKFIGFDININKELFDEFINAVCKNKKVLGLFMGSAEVDYTIDDVEKKLKYANKNFMFYHYEKDYKILD